MTRSAVHKLSPESRQLRKAQRELQRKNRQIAVMKASKKMKAMERQMQQTTNGLFSLTMSTIRQVLNGKL